MDIEAEQGALDTGLAHVYAPDLLGGAFMGDAVLKSEDADLSTRFGRVTLLDFPESDDFVFFRMHHGMVFIAAGYRPGIAAVRWERVAAGVGGFIEQRLAWIAREHPRARAMLNPAMEDALRRTGRRR